MKNIICALALVLLLAAASGPSSAGAKAPPAASTPSWPQQHSDIRPEERVRFGILANGMRYAIMRNATPPGTASLRLRIDAGSLSETEDQRGLAHFIEHMVLNGTTHVPEGEFVHRLEREGLKFGPDTNATTQFEQTIFMLDLPTTSTSTVDTALFLLREVTDQASFNPAAIDRERGIVLSEERTRDSPQYRALVDELAYLMPGDLLPRRLPIGLTEIIRTAPRARFVDFYDKYYRPERATLIAVGDFDVAAMEARIKGQFESWRGEGPAGASPPPPVIAATSADARVLIEPGAQTQASLTWVRAVDMRPDNEAKRKEKLIEQLGLNIINRRLERIAATISPPPFLGAGAMRMDQGRRFEVVQLTSVAQPGRWQPALAAIEQEQRRVMLHDFTQAELEREIAELRSALVAGVSGAATRRTATLAQSLVNAVNEDRVFSSPADSLALFEKSVKGLTAAAASAATRILFRGPPRLYLSSQTAVEGGDAALRAAFDQSRHVPVSAPAVQQAGAWPYATFGTPGTVVARSEIDGLGATAIRFANGVRLTVKPTKFSEDSILVSVRFGGGQLETKKNRPNPAWAIGSGAFIAGGLGKMSFEDLQQELTGIVYSADVSLDDDVFLLQGRTRPQDMTRQMQVLAAYLTDPGWRPSFWDRLRAYSGTMHDQMETTPSGVFGRDADALLRSGDRRWATPSREEMAAGALDDARALLSPALGAEPIEVVIVGDINVEEAIRQVATTFGALPQRGPLMLPADASRLHFPAAGIERRTHKGRADQGLAFIAWPTNDFYADQRKTRATNLLGLILQLRLTDEIREKQGTTYSPSAGHSPSDTFPGYGYLAAQIEAPPEKIDGFFADALRIAADLRDRPISDDELQRARRPLLESLQRQRASNEWWLNALGGVQEHPERAQSVRVSLAQYQSITAADIQNMARLYLVDSKAWRLAITPEAH